MSESPVPPVPRRGFLGRLLGGSLAAAIGSLPAAPLLAQDPPEMSSDFLPEHLPLPTAAAGRADPDMSWLERLTTPRRMVFDSGQLEEGVALHHVRVMLANYAAVEHTSDADWSVVLTIRHQAIPIVLGDALWAKYRFLGKSTKLKDPATGGHPTRNPFLNANVDVADRHSLIWPDGGLDTLMKRGVVVLGCGLALRRISSEIAKDTKQEPGSVHDEVLAHVVPGVYVMPSGVFGTIRAEEAGCRLFKSS